MTAPLANPASPQSAPSGTPARSRWAVLVLAVAAALAIWAVLIQGLGGWLQPLQERLGDSVWRAGASLSATPTADERRVVVVDVDERSLAVLGPWPWPRAAQAQLLDAIAAAGARQQVLDVVFADPRPDDAALAAAVQRHKPVLAQVFALPGAQGAQPRSGQLAGALDWSTCPAPFADASGFIANTPAIAQHGNLPSGHTGHISPRVAADGVVRHQPAVVCVAGRSYPALSLAALMAATGDANWQLQRGSWWESPWLLTSASGALAPVPLDAAGDMRIGWRLHPHRFVSVSAVDVLAGRVPGDVLRGAWVLVGSSAFGLNDTIATPFGGGSSGLQAHVQLMVGLLDGTAPFTPRAAPWLQGAAAALALALLLAAGGRGRRPVLGLPLAALGCAAAMAGAHALLLWQINWWVGWLAPALLVLLAGVALGVAEHALSRRERDRLFQHLSSYLPAPVAASLALQPPSSAIRASTRQVSVLFADIRNFSAYCEARPPEEAAAVLHAFFSAAARVVQQHGGVVESFHGDAVVAVWNASDDEKSPHISGAGAPSALKAAIELLANMHAVLPQQVPAGLEPLALGLGLETGPAMAGSFGLASRRTHMVMGRTVTIASRLVGMTADLAHPILVGEGMAAQLGGAGLQSMGTFLLDGLRTPHHVYAVPLVAAHAASAGVPPDPDLPSLRTPVPQDQLAPVAGA